jgi:hypothetical protein
MYDEISIIIILGLILIFILLHFDFKNKINKFEKNFKNVENTFNKKILKMRKVLDNNFGKIVGKIDCEGEWKCNKDCIKEFKVHKYPKYGGKECPTKPGSDSIECVEEQNCPKQGNKNAVIGWGMCNDNCTRSWYQISPPYGQGYKYPENLQEAIYLGELINNPYIPCENNEGNCTKKNCQGHWSECDTNCKKHFIVTENENILGDCPNKNKVDNCNNGEGQCLQDDVDCLIQLADCHNYNGNYLRQNMYNGKQYKILEESKGNGISCENTIKMMNILDCKNNAHRLIKKIKGDKFIKVI